MNTMENLKEVRRQNLNLVLTSLGGHGAQKKLSEKSGIYYTYISNLRQGHKEMGEEIARKIEAAMSLSPGWMDQSHSSVQDEQGTDAKTPEDVAMDQRLLALWEQLPNVRRWIVLEMMEDMIAAAQVRSTSSAPIQSPLL